MIVHWHRRDLRLQDSPAHARADELIIGLYVVDPTRLERTGTVQLSFLLDSLKALRAAYREAGGELLLREGEPTAVIPAVLDSLGARAIQWETEYGDWCVRRDAAVRDAVRSRDGTVTTDDTRVLHPPGTILTNDGTPYQVFSYYWRKWRKREKPAVAEFDTSDIAATVDIEEGDIPAIEECDRTPPDATIPPGGTDAATKRLARFCAGPIYTYPDDREIPSIDGTSRISQDLALGTLGIRQVWWETEAAYANAETTEAREAVTAFQRQLAWRDFYTQVLWDRPKTETETYQAFPNAIDWKHDPAAEKAWKQGKTGYPIVDAGMRQLIDEGWMHNRVRMIVASFLTKDLLLSWRIGYEWFRENLVDFDIANNAGGWQWAASTGTDAQPYFRIFNPMTQGERYDPDGTYITRYVPELRGIDPGIIHGWDDLSATQREQCAPDYPPPIVEHADRREQAIAMFEAARGMSS